MKKLLCLLMVLFCVLVSFAACRNDEQAESKDSVSEEIPESGETSEAESSAEDVSTSEEESSTEDVSTSEAESSAEDVSTSEEESGTAGNSALVGIWVDDYGDTIIFADDGTGEMRMGPMGVNITWSATAHTITISMDFDGEWADYCKDAPYSVKDGELTITVHGSDVVFRGA